MMYGYGNMISPSNRLFSGGGGGATSYLIDDYGSAVVGYSLRKIESTYSGNVIRVRRSSDNVEQDIGLSGDNLDTTSLLSFIGANDGHIVSWYDQSGNSRTITQSTATNQPKIVSSGSLIVGSNGLPAIETDGNDFLNNSGYLAPAYDFTYSFVYDVPNLTASHALQSLGGNTNQVFISRSGGTDRIYCTQAQITAPKLSIGGHASLVTGLSSGGYRMSAWEDGSVIQTNQFANTTTTGDGMWLFSRLGASGICPSGTQLQEVVMFDTDLTSNAASINTDINNYYKIY